jgi:glycosyltransferase involved in cell wall biosynthesis
VNKRKTILILASTFPRWAKDSTPPFVYELSKQFVDKGRVVVLVPYSKGSTKYETMDGMTVHRFNYWPFSKKLADGAILPNLKTNKLFWLQVPFFMLFELIAIRRMIKKYNPDVIHAHWIIPQGINAVLVKKLTGWHGRIVCTTHGGDIFGLRFLDWLKKWVISNCSAVTVVSESIKLRLKDFKLETPIELIPMGVDTSKFNISQKDDTLRFKYDINGPFLLFVGRLSEKKGVEYLIRAMPEILKHLPSTKLLIAGHGELSQSLEILVNEKLGISENVIFAGGIPNSELPKYYATADIFVGPSIIARGGDREGFPVSFMEAMASKTPLVISDLEIFNSLKEPDNVIKAVEKSPNSLANSLIRLLNDKQLQNKIADNNLKLIYSDYALEVIGEKYWSVLNIS